MKKLILYALIVLVSNMQAQFTVTKLGTSTQILNNEIFVFNSVDENTSKFGFKINNTTNDAISMKIKCESITNSNGDGMTFCFAGSCSSAVTAGTTYPTQSPFVSIIPALGNNGNFDYFHNTNTGNGVNTVDYVFKFFQVNSLGSQIGTSVSFTYRYQPVLSNNAFDLLENSGIQLNSNITDNQLDIKVNNETKLSIFDLNGRNVSNTSLNSGTNSIDVAGLKASIYFLNFIDRDGNRITSKFIKK